MGAAAKMGTRTEFQRLQAEANIRAATMSLGLTFVEAAMLIRYDEAADTAFWRHNKATGEESIHIGPAMASLPVSAIAMVLRHEILHRSMYHGFGERFENPVLANLVLDVFINRLLADAYPDEFPRACKEIYPPQSKTTPVALADCTADPLGLPRELREIWIALWRPAEKRDSAGFNPASLYYRLIRLGSLSLQGNPFGDPQSADEPPAFPGGVMEKAAGKVLEDIGNRLPPSSSQRGSIEEFSVVPARISSTNIENFLRRLRLRHVTDDLATRIIEPLRGGVRIQPYPMFPTRLGLIYQIVGLSELYTLYWNQDTSYRGSRLAIAVYLDVSGSMEQYFPLVTALAEALTEFPLRLRLFDDSLRSGDFENLAAGKVHGGGGTNFDLPLQDLMKDQEIVAGLLCTDGEGDVSPVVGNELRKSRKKLYVVYFVPSGVHRRPSSLDQYATETIEFGELP